MKLKCLLMFAVVVAVAQAASIHQQKRSAVIPVQVVYDDKPSEAVRNLDNLEEKPQLPLVQEEEKKEAEKEETILPADGVKNLEAKPQLSATEEVLAFKNPPAPVDDATKVKIVTPDDAVEVVQPEITSVPLAPYQEQNIDDIYDKILEIINTGAKKIKTDFEKIPETEHSAPQKQDILSKVNATLEDFLDNTKKLISLRGVGTLKQDSTSTSPIPNPQNIFQQIISSFQTFSSNLFSGLNPAGQQGVQSDGTAGGPPNPITIAQGIFSQLQGNLGSLFGARPPGAQSDDGTTQGPQNPLQFIQQQFSNIFNRPTPVPGAQGDEVTSATPSNPIVGFVQGAINNVQNAFNPTAATPAQHDEVTQGTTPGGPLAFIQQAGQNVINAFRPGSGTTSAPAALAATPTPANPVAAGIANAQSQLTQVFPQLGGAQAPAVPAVPAIPGAPAAAGAPAVPGIPQIPGVPENPFQQQAQQAITAGAGGANQVVAGLTQQGVPVPEQVGTAINTAQQAAQQGAGIGAGTSKPDATAPVASATPATPAAETPASDNIPADEVELEEVNELALVAKDEVVPIPVPVKEAATPAKEDEKEIVKVTEISENIDDAPIPEKVIIPDVVPEVKPIVA